MKTHLFQDIAGREDVTKGEFVFAIAKHNHRKLVCYNCKKEGHIRPKCPKFKQKIKARKHSKDVTKANEVMEDSSKENGKNALLFTVIIALLAKDFKTKD